MNGEAISSGKKNIARPAVRVGVVGLGTVGHVLANALMLAGHPVAGVDLSVERRNELRRRVGGAPARELLELSDSPVPAEVHVIAVNTPLAASGREADLSFLLSASRAVGHVLRRGDLVIVRSTVPVGTVRGVVWDELTRSCGLAPDDFHLAYAPERCIVGDEARELATLPQLVGGIDAEAAERTREVLAGVTGPVVIMQAVEAAELAKLALNSYSDLRHAFSNQIGMIAERFDLDAVRLIDEANWNYPRDQMARPSPGVGGSCLTKDPYLLAQSLDDPTSPNLFTLGRAVNDGVAAEIVGMAVNFTASHTPRPRALVCGAAFKAHPPTDDTRGSVGVEVAREVAARGVSVLVHDPCVNADHMQQLGLSRQEQLFDGTQFDVVLLLSDHSYYRETLADSKVGRLLMPDAMVYDPWHLVDPIALQRDFPGASYAAIGLRP